MLHSPPSNELTQLASPTSEATAPQPTEGERTDEQLIEMWLHGRSAETQAAYRSDVRRFLEFAGKRVREVGLADVQSFADSLDELGLMAASRRRMLAAVKSLFAFAHRLGYLPVDTARPLRLPQVRDQLHERILDESEVQRMIGYERNPRNQTILLLLYATGIRVSELRQLRWRDVAHRDAGGQITVFGKGGVTRTILVPERVRSALEHLRPQNAAGNRPIFESRQGGMLHRSQLVRIVRRAAERAGISKHVSPHWLRHAHCSHSLDRGAPISLVQATCGHASVQTTGRYLHARPSESSSTYLPL